MPTFDDYCKDKKVITMHPAFLRRGDMAARRLYAHPDFGNWYTEEVKQYDEGFAENPVPSAQADVRLKQYVHGEPIAYIDEIRCLRHKSGIIWELKTRNVRMFGAFVQKDCLLLYSGADAGVLHAEDDEPIQEGYVDPYEVHAETASAALLALANGNFEFISSRKLDDVISN